MLNLQSIVDWKVIRMLIALWIFVVFIEIISFFCTKLTK